MKKVLFLFTALLLIGAAACKKVDKLLTFYVEDAQNIRIASNFPLGVFTQLAPVTVTTNSSQSFANNDTRADLVKDVKLDKLTLTITDPSSQNFDFLQSIEIRISADGADEIVLASLNSIPQGVRTITLTPTEAKLDAYLKASQYTLKTRATVGRNVPQDVTVRADSRFKVTADPL
ncbi:hypothetical protein LJ737_03720 [Hymenobacter sp. 15J16-1T3B]|uniref:hypothetical protein n=1 Tax=Hymenobacter sp. 15J16-1T3B TaxID=2886941 RepID=UPI001D10ED29|nr:hypothetical protein [Hymenobacter sp. 15J16-1T3B]MCC3156329.1 hypothetical protein [Hymenobacter sp. 15J16-1T3B]